MPKLIPPFLSLSPPNALIRCSLRPPPSRPPPPPPRRSSSSRSSRPPTVLPLKNGSEQILLFVAVAESPATRQICHFSPRPLPDKSP